MWYELKVKLKKKEKKAALNYTMVSMVWAEKDL